MKKEIFISLRKALLECSWCKKKIGENDDIYKVPIKTPPNEKLKGQEGKAFKMKLKSSEHDFAVIISKKEEVKQEPYMDLFITACSEECAKQIKNDIIEEKEFMRHK